MNKHRLGDDFLENLYSNIKYNAYHILDDCKSPASAIVEIYEKYSN